MEPNKHDLTTSTSLDSARGKEYARHSECEDMAGNDQKKFLKIRRRRPNDAPPLGDSSQKPRGRMSRNRLTGFERRNIHLSRPETPQAVPGCSQDTAPIEVPYIDPKLLKHLTTLLEQEMDHISHVVQEMQANHAEESNILSVYNVMRQLTCLRLQLVRFQDQPRAASLEIGASREIETYLANIETVCEAAKDIVLRYSDDATNGVFDEYSGKYKDTNMEPAERVPLRRAPKVTALDKLMRRVEQDLSTISPRVHGNKMHNSKYDLENYRRRETRQTVDKPEEKTNKNKLQYQSGTVTTFSDTDTDEEMSNINTLQEENQKYQWPKLDTNNQKMIHKEETLFSLMSEIDDLMKEVGLEGKKGKKAEPSNLTYEVLMMGSGEMNKEKLIPQKKSVAPKFAAKTFKPKQENKSKRKSKEKKTDAFVDELDKLLDECDWINAP